MTRTLHPFALPALVIALGLLGWPCAVVAKTLDNRGTPAPGDLNRMVGVLFDNSARVEVALKVIAAGVLLGALAALLCGVWLTIRGERNGVEVMLSGVYGLVGVMAALSIVM